MTTLELLICVVLVAVSAFTSASEVSIFSLSRFQLRYLKDHFRASHRRIKRLLADPGGLLISILVINEMVNIALSSVVAGIIARHRETTGGFALAGVPSWAIDTLIGVLVTAPVVLLLCEITPKIIGARANQLIATLTAGAISAIYDLTKPVRLVLKRVVLVASRLAGDTPTEEAASGILKESDFLHLVEEGHREGAVHESELELIRNVFELDNTTVEEIFTPIHQVQTLPATTTVRGALTIMRANRYSRIPVVAPQPGKARQVVGILFAKDLLRAKLDPALLSHPIDEYVRPAMSVPPQTRLNSLFRKFKQQRNHLAIVSAGGAGAEAIGIVTMNDVLEALFEDLAPEEAPAR